MIASDTNPCVRAGEIRDATILASARAAWVASFVLSPCTDSIAAATAPIADLGECCSPSESVDAINCGFCSFAAISLDLPKCSPSGAASAASVARPGDVRTVNAKGGDWRSQNSISVEAALPKCCSPSSWVAAAAPNAGLRETKARNCASPNPCRFTIACAVRKSLCADASRALNACPGADSANQGSQAGLPLSGHKGRESLREEG
eukprot:1655804-Amphidinium_carterae.1